MSKDLLPLIKSANTLTKIVVVLYWIFIVAVIPVVMIFRHSKTITNEQMMVYGVVVQLLCAILLLVPRLSTRTFQCIFSKHEKYGASQNDLNYPIIMFMIGAGALILLLII